MMRTRPSRSAAAKLTMDRLSSDQMPSAHQLPGALHGVPDVEQLSDQRLDPAQRPALVPGEPVRQRPFAQLGLQPQPLPPLLFGGPCTRHVAHTAYPGHTPPTTRRHDPISTSSFWLAPEKPPSRLGSHQGQGKLRSMVSSTDRTLVIVVALFLESPSSTSLPSSDMTLD